MINAIIFSRVSTATQDTERQTLELTEYANKFGYNLVGTIEEQISGAKKTKDRPELIRLLKLIDDGNVNKVLVWELSRLGRDVIEILQVIETFNKKKVCLFIKNFNLETLNDDLTPNSLSMFMIQVLLSVASMERINIRQRMESGYNAFRTKGGVVGRKKGKKEERLDFLSKHSEVVKHLRKGLSVRNISKLTGNTSSATIIKIKKVLNTPLSTEVNGNS